MDYEKKYKEALELARVAAFNGHQSLMEGIFPELAESEDEKTRKEIIYHIKNCDDTIDEETEKRMIAWLENIPYTIDHEKREGFHLGYKAALEKHGEPSDTHYWTEEEIEPIISDYLRGAEHYGGMIGRLRCLKPKSLEKQGNSPIKWNKNTEGNKPQVNHSVLMKTTHGIAEGEWKGEYWHQYRWAGIVRDSDVLSWMELSDLEKQGEQKPQRMVSAEAKEALYDKPACAWSEEDDKMYNSLTEFEKAVKQVMEEAIECGDTHNLKADADMLLRLTQKPWSEKDEKILKAIHNSVDVECLSKNELDYVVMVDWFNALKDRVQPKQEWSEEDEKRIKDIIYFLDTAKKHYASTVELDACINWLKSLKERIGGEQ